MAIQVSRKAWRDGFRIAWSRRALRDDVGGWPIVRDVSTVVLNPTTGLMEMTVEEGNPLQVGKRKPRAK